ncbi:hypothetical protein HDE69_004972 [Pedobacter cryoconitis]|uniref:DUF4280 domain-containing protein n=1 Tax=Pedobacter cryoconitis TaxID=188932 RepID=A0A7W8YXY6_9SPHI|nr:DUF4280 domain-containing protein [Pedobacter cryoconitis]MBB5623884.1 hypothetical protein [Pedobacter cryoconitis]
MAKDDLYVPEGAFLKCDMGAMIMTLKVTPKKHNLYGLPIATETDKIPLLNIPCFVTCSVNGSPCTPVGTEWKKTHDGAQKVLGKAPLLKSSYCKCQKGGTITIFLDKEEATKALEEDKTNRVDGIPWLDGAIGAALTGPVGLVVDAFTDGGRDVTEGIGRGLRKGLKGSWNGLVGMVTHPIDTVKGIGTLAGIVIVGYGGGPLTYPISSPAERLKKFDETFGTSLKNTHDAIGNAIEDTWDKKVVNGTTEERSELGGQLIEAVAEAVVGTKGAGLAVKGVGAGAKFALGAERLAELTATITKLRNAMKLEGLMAKVKGIFKVGVRRLTPASFGVRMLADNPELLKIWNDTLRTLASSKRSNVFKKYLDNLEKGIPMTNKELEGTFNYVRESFKKNAEAAGHKIDGEIHHWNYSKSAYPEQITNPRNLTEPIDRPKHTDIHKQTSSNESKPWYGPIKPEHEIPINSSPLD